MNSGYHLLARSGFKKKTEFSELEIVELCQLYEREKKERIHSFAKQKKILPFIAQLLASLDLEKAFWQEILESYQQRNQRILEESEHLFRQFKKNHVEKIFVTENLGALLSADEDISLFASGDVDLYADISEKEKIYTSFQDTGYQIEERYSFQKLVNTSFCSPERFPDGFYFSVAWDPLSRMKLPCFVKADAFLEWDRCYKFRNTEITLPDRSTLMYICLLHVSLHSFSRAPDIRLYADIKNLSLGAIDWNWILKQARSDKTTIRVLASCVIASKLVRANIPKEMLSCRESEKVKLSALLSLVYNEKHNCLKYEPKGWKVLLIEILSEDHIVLESAFRMLFPERGWTRETYLPASGSSVLAYCRHIRNLF